MKRITALKILNPVLAVIAIAQLLTGALHSFLPRDLFELVHMGGGLVLAAIVLAHVILNWNWVRANFLT